MWKNIKGLNNLEIFCWLALLAAAAFIDPVAEGHSSFCLFKNLGWAWCPGCGLGRSIAFLYHGELLLSLKTHPLGIITVGVIIYRIIYLLRRKLWLSAGYEGGSDA
nr:DUF2752 domain-containing protein [candidate division Zixibacteria bacterium]